MVTYARSSPSPSTCYITYMCSARCTYSRSQPRGLSLPFTCTSSSTSCSLYPHGPVCLQEQASDAKPQQQQLWQPLEAGAQPPTITPDVLLQPKDGYKGAINCFSSVQSCSRKPDNALQPSCLSVQVQDCTSHCLVQDRLVRTRLRSAVWSMYVCSFVCKCKCCNYAASKCAMSLV